MKPTIGIVEAGSQSVATELLKLLADEYVLYTKTRNAYWNMEDTHFYEREKLFDEQANQLTAIIDSIAKRIRTMEHYAPAETPMLSAAPDEVHQAWIQGTPSKRLGRASEVAKAFIYLACDESSYCNGTQIILDGGVMA